MVLESVAIVPQLLMMSRTSNNKSIISHYLFALGSYKALYFLNWIYRYFDSFFYDPVLIVAGIVETIIIFYGFFSIFIEPKVYLVLIYIYFCLHIYIHLFILKFKKHTIQDNLNKELFFSHKIRISLVFILIYKMITIYYLFLYIFFYRCL